MQQPFDINNTSLVIARLEKGETVKSFDCGDADLNDFILNESMLYRKEKLAVTYVMEDESDTEHNHIAAFFILHLFFVFLQNNRKSRNYGQLHQLGKRRLHHFTQW